MTDEDRRRRNFGRARTACVVAIAVTVLFLTGALQELLTPSTCILNLGEARLAAPCRVVFFFLAIHPLGLLFGLFSAAAIFENLSEGRRWLQFRRSHEPTAARRWLISRLRVHELRET